MMGLRNNFLFYEYSPLRSLPRHRIQERWLLLMTKLKRRNLTPIASGLSRSNSLRSFRLGVTNHFTGLLSLLLMMLCVIGWSRNDRVVWVRISFDYM